MQGLVWTAPTLLYRLPFSSAAQIGNGHYLPQTAQNLAPHDVSNFVDGSGPIFSMYLEMATEEDKKMVENWKADADGILIFVRLLFETLCVSNADSIMVIDWSILCCCCIVNFSVDSGHPTEPTEHLQFLPREYLSGYDQSKCFEFPPYFPTPILSAKLRSLGQRALVLEFGDKTYLCSACNVAAAMGTKIPQGHSDALQSTQACTDPFVLCRRRRELSPSMGSRNIADACPHFPVPVLRRPGCVPIQCQYDDFQVTAVVGRRLHGPVWMYHIDAHLSS